MTRKSSTETLVGAMRILARDIQSGDGVANVAIAEAADRLEELHADHLRDATKMAEQQARINALLTERNRFGVDIQGAVLAGRVQEGHQLEPQLRLVARIGDELKAAKARISDLEAQAAIGLRAVVGGLAGGEPFAWATFDGEGGYDLRLYEGNESYRDDWQAVNRRFHDWVFPLYDAPDPATVAVTAGALADSQLLDDLETVAREYMVGFSVVYRHACDGEPAGFVAMRRRYRTEPAPTLRDAASRLLTGGE